MTQREKFRLIAAPFTPMDKEGEVDFDRISELNHYLKMQGVDGLFIGGTTGESMSLTIDERLRLTEEWKESADGEMEFIVHTGHACLKDARALAKHAESLGVDGVATIGPVFFPSATPEALVDFCRRIAEAAPRTPFYYYHMPSMARVSFPANHALDGLSEIPTFAGVKFTHNDLDDFRTCMKMAADKWQIFFGRDELLLEGLKAGARSAVGSTYNFATPLYREIVQAYEGGDLKRAEATQFLATSAIDAMIKAGGLAAVKTVMDIAGVRCGPPRLPLQPTSIAQRKQLCQTLEALSYFKTIRELTLGLASHSPA